MPAIAVVPAILWWIGLAVVVLVVLPAVVAIAHGIVRAARQIRDYGRDVETYVGRSVDDLDAGTELERMRALCADLRRGTEHLVSRLERT